MDQGEGYEAESWVKHFNLTRNLLNFSAYNTRLPAPVTSYVSNEEGFGCIDELGTFP